MGRHLKVLRASGLVHVETLADDARGRVYSLRPEEFVALQAWLDQVHAFWSEQLGRFKARRRRRSRGTTPDEPPAYCDASSRSTSTSIPTPRSRCSPTRSTPGTTAARTTSPIRHAVVGIRFEPFVGGRLIEVYDRETGEGLTMARIEVWEPGKRLVFVDDRETEADVTFEASDGGTRVTLEHRGLERLAPQEAEQHAQFGWRLVFGWYEQYARRCNRTDHLARRTRMTETSPISPYLYYEDGVAALEFLADAFGFQERMRHVDQDGTLRHGEMQFGTSVVMLASVPNSTPNTLGGATGGDLRHRRRRRRPLRTSARRRRGDRGRTGGQALRRAHVRRPRSRVGISGGSRSRSRDGTRDRIPHARRSPSSASRCPKPWIESSGQHAAFVVRGKKFAYYLDDHHGDGRRSVCCRAPAGENDALVAADPERYFIPAYIGPRGWVGYYTDLGGEDWDEVRDLVVESYRLAAPKRLVAQLDVTE